MKRAGLGTFCGELRTGIRGQPVRVHSVQAGAQFIDPPEERAGIRVGAVGWCRAGSIAQVSSAKAGKTTKALMASTNRAAKRKRFKEYPPEVGVRLIAGFV